MSNECTCGRRTPFANLHAMDCPTFQAAPLPDAAYAYDAAPAPATSTLIFEGLGSNWKWATIDYRGVARVHTFEPKFSANDRIELPVGKGNSAIVEKFSMTDLPTGWKPLLMRRLIGPPYNTDRFGKVLPTGADPIEAADVIDIINTVVDAIMQPGPKFPIDTAVDVKSFVPQNGWATGGVVVGFDGPLHIVRRNGNYDAYGVDELRVTVTEKELFHAKLGEALGRTVDIEDANKLFDAGCRFQ